ncbi:hypothetical protein UlMin_022807 [Ulmus minor]
MEARLARHHSKSWALATRKADEKSKWWVVDGEVHEIGENEHEPLCKRYMELYQELRENWERLYWDEGYFKELGEDHAKYDSLQADDDEDFSPHMIAFLQFFLYNMIITLLKHLINSENPMKERRISEENDNKKKFKRKKMRVNKKRKEKPQDECVSQQG